MDEDSDDREWESVFPTHCPICTELMVSYAALWLCPICDFDSEPDNHKLSHPQIEGLITDD